MGSRPGPTPTHADARQVLQGVLVPLQQDERHYNDGADGQRQLAEETVLLPATVAVGAATATLRVPHSIVWPFRCNPESVPHRHTNIQINNDLGRPTISNETMLYSKLRTKSMCLRARRILTPPPPTNKKTHSRHGGVVWERRVSFKMGPLSGVSGASFEPAAKRTHPGHFSGFWVPSAKAPTPHRVPCPVCCILPPPPPAEKRHLLLYFRV